MDGSAATDASRVYALGMYAGPVPAAYKADFPTADLLAVVKTRAGSVALPPPVAAALAAELGAGGGVVPPAGADVFFVVSDASAIGVRGLCDRGACHVRRPPA